jgi:hypothetical protein
VNDAFTIGDVTHSRGQRLARLLWRFYGPAQTGLPPYPTQDEQDRYRENLKPPAPVERQLPPGFHVEVYTDSTGVKHRSLVRDQE